LGGSGEGIAVLLGRGREVRIVLAVLDAADIGALVAARAAASSV
jgi:hypothetical protein